MSFASFLQALAVRAEYSISVTSSYDPSSLAMTAKTSVVDAHNIVNVGTIPATTDTSDSANLIGTRLSLHATGARDVKTETDEQLPTQISRRLATVETWGGSCYTNYIRSEKFEEYIPAR